jgi:hypothetical protein
MSQNHDLGQPFNTPTGVATAALPAMPPESSAAPGGLTAEVMTKLEGGKRVEARGRITNTFTYVLAGAALLVGTFSAGAWVGRDNAPAATTGTSNGAAAALNAFAAGASGPSGGFGGRNGGAGFSGASGFTGAPAGAGATTGTVKLVDGNNVYIATAQGTTIKITTTPQSQVSVSKQGTVADLAVGETIIVQGEAGADGTIAATTIRSGTAGLGGGAGRGAGTANATGATGGTGATGR